MKRFAILFLSLFSLITHAGIGGVAGGSSESHSSGGSIHFQSDSTYVNPMYNRTLCLNSRDVYEAVVRKCVKYVREDGERKCVKTSKTKIYQPRISSRTRCNGRRDDECYSRESYRYTQGRTRYINVRRASYETTEKVTVRRCR